MSNNIWQAVYAYFQAREENDLLMMEQSVRNIESWAHLAENIRDQPRMDRQ